ncbi:gas vesicle protein GvpM [Halogeometricum sp. CBA1124]|uniref:gas vesicle protein GvpM n=1 Tax=Halogeometricum sp. CBA1124 TaxID=2668071 RepID=UPI001428EF8E|nr:gas vesicle protein [Halogeometricum sp. CBA1124]MUV56263.1 gas vesicle protein [Halogeometricum sp. CBA1124]
MEPDPPTDDDAVVDLVDVLLEEGAVLDADVVVSVADIPLVGIKLRAALAGMTTMRDYGLFDEWDERLREERRRSETRANRDS